MPQTVFLPRLHNHQETLSIVLTHPPRCEPKPKGGLQYTPPDVTHLQVLEDGNRPGSPQTPTEPKQDITVQVFDGCSGKKVSLVMKRTDIIGKLKEDFLKEMPKLQETLSLAFNGKPVYPEMTMRELNVKPGAIFNTYQRCVGGHKDFLKESLAFNGKPVHPEMTMCELNVMPGATSVTN